MHNLFIRLFVNGKFRASQDEPLYLYLPKALTCQCFLDMMPIQPVIGFFHI